MQDQPYLLRRTYRLERAIDTDDGTRSVLEATLEFDDQKGMFQVKSKLTTKQVSHNPVRMDAIQQAKAQLERDLCDYGMQLREEWQTGQPETDPELPFDEPSPRERYHNSVEALKENGVSVHATFGDAVKEAKDQFLAEKKKGKSNAKQVAMPDVEAENE